MKTEGNNKEKDNPFVEEKKHSKLPVVILFVIGVSILFLGFLRNLLFHPDRRAKLMRQI